MTVYFGWKSTYDMGDQSINAQHRQILNIINEMHNVLGMPNERETLKNCIERLVSCTIEHFQHEEQLMQEHGYPDLQNHKVAHEQMRRQMLGLQENLKLMTGTDLCSFLKQWWVEHLQTYDVCYVPYLNGNVKSTTIPPIRTTSSGQMPNHDYSW